MIPRIAYSRPYTSMELGIADLHHGLIIEAYCITSIVFSVQARSVLGFLTWNTWLLLLLLGSPARGDHGVDLQARCELCARVDSLVPFNPSSVYIDPVHERGAHPTPVPPPCRSPVCTALFPGHRSPSSPSEVHPPRSRSEF